jgi:hypothetical protein
VSRLTPERLAELRRMVADEVWTLPSREDVAALIASRDQFETDLAKARHDRDSWQAIGADRAGAVVECARLETELAETVRERDRLWLLLETERGLTGSIRLHAEALKRVTAFGVALKIGDDAWAVADYHAGALLLGLRPRWPQGAPQPHAPGSGAAFAGNETPEAQRTAQRAAEDVEPPRCPAPNPLFLGETCSLTAGHDGDHRDGRRGGWPNHPHQYPRDGRLYADGPPCRHDATWLVATPDGPQCMVCGPATSADAIAPEDEGVSTADVHAQTAADEHAELRTPEWWCDKYDLRVYDPDGWRSATDPRDWDQPITLAEFERRTRTSTVDSRGGWDRMNADLRRAGNGDGA